MLDLDPDGVNFRSRGQRGAIIAGAIAVLAVGWVAVQLVKNRGAITTVVTGGAPVPPPYVNDPPWTWPKAPGAGHEYWLAEPWGGTGPTPDYLGGAMTGAGNG